MANPYTSKVVLADGRTLIDLTADTIEKSKVLSGFTFHDKSGAPLEGECTFDVDSSDATVSSSEQLDGTTSYARGAKVTGSMPNIGKQTGTISTKAGTVTISQGYHDGSGVVSISSTEQAKIIATNIRKDVTILGVKGTMSGSEDVKAQSKTVAPSFTEQTITPDASYNYLSQVKISAIPVAYADNSAGGQTVTIG